MSKKNTKGQSFKYSKTEIKLYQDLKKNLDKILRISSKFWNWPIVTTLTSPSISRLLHLNDLYIKNLKNAGSIIEFGVQYGTSSNILYNLRDIYEPQNYNRKIYSFDTFTGFTSISKNDSKKNKVGDYKTSSGYENILENILSINQRLNSKPNIKKHQIIKGDVCKTFKQWSKNNKHEIISMAIFDMDIFKPTNEVLKYIKNHLTKGSILVFDEINHADFPGETIALKKNFDLKNIKLNQSKFLTHACWFKY
jgi:predicted O-methyltransferase YrrM